MSLENIEIEIKISLTSEEFASASKKLEQIAVFVGDSKQIDTYYSPNDRLFVQPKYPYQWLSIRERNGKAILNYKHFFPEGAEKHTHCNEYETAIADACALEKTLIDIGISKIVRVEKNRKIYMYRDSFEVVLDTVKGLGSYMEIEAKRDLGGIEKTRAGLFSVLEELQIGSRNFDYRGYPFLLMKKEGVI